MFVYPAELPTSWEDYLTFLKQPGKFPTNIWACSVECRKRGSTGVFELAYVIIRAEERDLTRYVIEDLDLAGYEPNIIRTRELVPQFPDQRKLFLERLKA